MSDAFEIDSLFSPHGYKPSSYRSVNWRSVSDSNGKYYQNDIRFKTESLMSSMAVYADSYLAMPIVLKSSTATLYTAASKIALKQSVLSLIYGVQITCIGSSGTLVNDMNIQFINHLRLILDNSSEYLTSAAAELQYGADSAVWPLTAPTNSTAANTGFADRVTFLQMSGFNAADNSFRILAYIPLRLIHPVFAAMDFPILNGNFEISFYPAIAQNTYATFLREGADAPSILNAAIGSVNGQDECRIYFKIVELQPDDAKEFQKKLSSEKGLVINRKYLDCETFTSVKNNSADNMEGVQITSGVMNPTGLYALLYASAADPKDRALNSQTVPLAPIGQLTNVSISLNNTPMITSRFNNHLDFWTELSQRMGGSSTNGNNLTLKDFITNQRIHYFDLSRAVKANNYPNASVSVQFTGYRPAGDTTACDYVFLIEKESSFTLTMKDGVCIVTKGTNI